VQVLRRGSEGEEVRRWQYFLIGQGLFTASADGVFGPLTERATRAFQHRARLAADGAVGPKTYAAALLRNFDPGISDPQGGEAGADWPPRPVFAPLVSNLERQDVFGAFRYEPLETSGEAIRIMGGWAQRNIVAVEVPQLAGRRGAPRGGRIRAHRMVADQVRRLFAAWQEAGLIGRVLSWEGSFVPRFVRGSRTTLSNHSWGTAFDINFAWNRLGAVPALRGQRGSVRELVPIAHELGFYWGGHFSRADGMHFEVARVL
jgi:hypothetical protein